LASSAAIDRDWIGAEFAKGIDLERALASNAKARAECPPEPTFGVLYCEIAAADERHVAAVEKIATRYGRVPSRSVSGGVGETLGRLKDKVAGIGATPLDCLSHDLEAKAGAIHWHTAWVYTFEAIGDSDSSRELAAILTEEQTHLEALQQGLNRLVAQHAMGDSRSSRESPGGQT
jgi:hypothetical protein